MDTIGTNLEATIAEILKNEGPGEAGLLAALDATLKHFQCVVGTIHRLDATSNTLHLLAHRGIPPFIMDKVSVIPVGKGMAGLAAERLEPVQVCNLQTDESGAAKPAARMTGMEGSISFPLLVNGRLRGTMGVAKPTAYDFTNDERALLMKIGSMIGSKLN